MYRAFPSITLDTSRFVAYLVLHSAVDLWGAYRSEDNDMATDNAVSTLGRTLTHHAEALGPDGGAAIATLWLQSLPLKVDTVEATVRCR